MDKSNKNQSCPFCENQFKETCIKDYEYWSLQLFNDDQYYIGRSVAVLKDRHIVDINELEKQERNELFEKVLPDIRSSLKKNIFT
jgi:diadenosine tetraphosphate (Ap4A) HIT family hydrolase